MRPGRLPRPRGGCVPGLVFAALAAEPGQRARRQPPAHPNAHQPERPQVIAREPGGLVNGAQGCQPGPRAEFAAAPVAESADRVVVLHQEAAPAHLLPRENGLTGQVEVLGDGHVNAGGVAEEPELGAEPRIEIKQLVLPVPGIPAKVEVQDPAV